MSLTRNTPAFELKFFNSWRLHRALKRFNASVDLSSRILTVKDLIDEGKDLIELHGVGPKTYEYLVQFLKENGLFETPKAK